MDTSKIPSPILEVLRGVAQVFFQENALSGALMVVGLAINSPLMAAGGLVGSAIGWATARLLKFDQGEIKAGIYGFNSTLVGIATFFHFTPSLAAGLLFLGGCVVSTIVTYLMRRFLTFPTYTSPFIVTTWGVYFLGLALQAPQVQHQPDDGYLKSTEAGFVAIEGETPPDGQQAKNESVGEEVIDFIEATGRGIGEVDFQGSFWTGLLFLIAIAINDKEHGAWTFVAALIATFAAVYHHDPSGSVALGVEQYSAPLTAIAVWLWRKSFIAALLGIVLTLPLTEFFTHVTHLPAYTAPFVLATWIILALGALEKRLYGATNPA